LAPASQSCRLCANEVGGPKDLNNASPYFASAIRRRTWPHRRTADFCHGRTSGTGAFSPTKINWTYDADGRLLRETRDAGNNGLGGANGAGDEGDVYRFDLAGNRTFKNVFYDANAATAATSPATATTAESPPPTTRTSNC
jgi:hypothetical protein